MRLNTSRPSCEERLLRCLNEGYALSRKVWTEYDTKQRAGQFDPKIEVPVFHQLVADWINGTYLALLDLFPSPLEANLFIQRFSIASYSYQNTDTDVAQLVYERIPEYIDRLHRVLERHLPRYTDLPISERLFVEDIDSFSKVRDVNSSVVSGMLKAGRIDLSEDQVQLALEAILDVPFHRTDWGGEINDLYTANVVVQGRRRPTAFLLKGNGLRSTEMRIRDCGKNGDQAVRLFQAPAELFVVQYVGPVSDLLIDDVRSKTLLRRSHGLAANFLIIDGQDTARLLVAYGKLVPSEAA